MLCFENLEQYYPSNQKEFTRFIVREYVHFQFLKIIFKSRFGKDLAFIGGNCLRFIYGNARFSEDLDLDDMGLNENDYNDVISKIKDFFERHGCPVEVANIGIGTYHLRFPQLKYKVGNGHKAETFLIQLNAESQHFDYKPEKINSQWFGSILKINVAPLDILLAQKFRAVLKREYNKGGDFFDIVFLLAHIKKPNYEYLERSIQITDGRRLKALIIEKCENIDMNQMANGVMPYLFNLEDAGKVRNFKNFIQSVRLE